MSDSEWVGVRAGKTNTPAIFPPPRRCCFEVSVDFRPSIRPSVHPSTLLREYHLILQYHIDISGLAALISNLHSNSATAAEQLPVSDL